jgi:predicted acyl esterase
MLDRPLDGPDYRARSAHWEKIRVPFLSAANWGGQGLHTRGNFEGYVNAASREKWLEVHGHAHWTHFYTDYGVALQKKFFGHFLKGEDTGWKDQPPVLLQVRHPGEKFVARAEREWPLARTQWTRFYLDPADRTLTGQPPRQAGSLPYEALGDGLLFLTPPLSEAMEITGPIAAKLFVSSTTSDADVFLVLRVFAPGGAEVTFHGANDPRMPVGQGWLRASHRKLDPRRTLPYRPYHTHDEPWPLTPGEVVELDIEVWPTCIVVPPGHRIGLAVRGKDYEYPGPPLVIPGVKYTLTGVGPFLHAHPVDRPASVFGGTNTLHCGPDRPAHVVLPVIPSR